MKKFIISLLCLITFATSQAQTVRTMVAEELRKVDNYPGNPRQRVARMTSMVLTDQWQTVVMVNGSSAFNMNTFQESRWDYTANKMLLNPANSTEQSYFLSFDYKLTNVTGMSKVQLRFLIPTAGTSFPFPDDTEPYTNLIQLYMPGVVKQNLFYPIYGNANMRQYGLQIQMRVVSYLQSVNILNGLVSLSSSILTAGDRVTLNTCSLNIYANQ